MKKTLLALALGLALTGCAAASAVTTPPPHSNILVQMSGDGDYNSYPLVLGKRPVTVQYRYRCSISNGIFSAYLEWGSDYAIRVTEEDGTAGSGSVTMRPLPAGNYVVSIASDCQWNVSVLLPSG
jgi:hypothetical protein